MTAMKPVYKLQVFEPRSAGGGETIPLTPAPGSAHSDPFQVASIPGIAGYQPYLDGESLRGRSGRLDFASRRMDIGERTLRLLDKCVSMDMSPLIRWVTAFVGDAQGRMQLGGLRVRIDESLDGGANFATFMTGRISKHATDGRTWIQLTIRDASDELSGMAFIGQLCGALGEPDPTACTGALAGAGAGSVNNGTHSYKVSTVTKMGESKPGAASNVVTVANNTVNGRVALSNIPVGQIPNPGLPANTGVTDTVARRIYRTKAGGATYYFLAEIADNTTTTYTDNIADASLGRLAPTANRSQYAFRQTLYPNGLMKPFGNVRPTTSLKATVKTVGGVSGRQISFQIDNDQLSRPDLTLTPYFVDLLRRVANTVDVSNGAAAEYPDWLRVHVINQQVGTNLGAEGDFKTASLLTPQRIALGDSDLSMTLPLVVADEIEGGDLEYVSASMFTVNDAVTLDFYSIEAPSEQNPLYIADVHPARLKRDLLNGYFGWIFQTGEALFGHIYGDPKRAYPYDNNAFDYLIANLDVTSALAINAFPLFRGIVTQKWSIVDFIEEQLDLAFGMGTRFDAAGILVPLDLRTPDTVPSVPTITSADLLMPDAPQWSHDRTAAVAIVQATHYVDRELSPSEYASYRDLPPGLVETTDVLTIVADVGDLDVGYNERSLDLLGFRSQPSESLNGRSRLEAVRAYVKRLIDDLRFSFARGPTTVSLRCRRNVTTDAQVGDWRILAVDELPDPITRQRGGTRLVRVLERTDDGASRWLMCLDAGLTGVADVPTLSSLTAETGNARHGVAAAWTLNAANDPVVVEIAQSAGGSAPNADSPLWLFAFRQTMDYVGGGIIRNLTSGSKYWVRARSVPDLLTSQHFPSAWVDGGSITTTFLTAPSAPATSGITNAMATCSWTNGDANAQVAFYLASPNTAEPVRLQLLAPGTTQFALTSLKASTSYRFEVAHIDPYDGETAHVGADFTTSGTLTLPAKPRIAIAEGEL